MFIILCFTTLKKGWIAVQSVQFQRTFWNKIISNNRDFFENRIDLSSKSVDAIDEFLCYFHNIVQRTIDNYAHQPNVFSSSQLELATKPFECESYKMMQSAKNFNKINGYIVNDMQKSDCIGNYKLIRKIGSGSFGEVYLAEDKNNRSQVAIKMELIKTLQPLLNFESNVLKSLHGGVGIPKLRWFGIHADYHVLVMDLLGPSIEQLFQYCNRRMSLKTVLMVADQLLTVIEFLHKKNFIHRDMKPDNILFGLDKARKTLHLIDFGLSKKYRNPISDQHIPFKTGKTMLGTARFCSINTHLSSEQSRRDDMESIAYILFYLQRGSLPWQNIKATKYEKYKLIGEKKRVTQPEELCLDLPNEFAIYLKLVKALSFEEEPKYSEYRTLFKSLFDRRGFNFDNIYDWDQVNHRQRNR